MLIQCKECGGQVSSLAKSCPHCGAPIRTAPAGRFRQWFEDWRREREEARRKFKEKQERLAEEERKRIKAEEEFRRKQKEEAAFNEYKRNFSYASMPYENPAYSTFDIAEIRKRLCNATSFSDVAKAVAPFPSAQVGYRVNLPWLTEWMDLDRIGRAVDVLYIAFCFDDDETCEKVVRPGHVLTNLLSKKALLKLAGEKIDEKSKAFIARYVSHSAESMDYYQTNIQWLPMIESHDSQRLDFFREIGLDPKIGDEGLLAYKRSNLIARSTGADVAQIWQESPLSRALDADDLDRLKFLLEWGANTEQWMFVCYRCDPGADRDDPGDRCDPLIFRVQSVEAFKLMDRAGMKWYPSWKSAYRVTVYNLVEHLWMGEPIVGKRLELLDYLYSIGYDKQLEERRESIEKSINLHEGRPYTNNVDIVKKWLSQSHV